MHKQQFLSSVVALVELLILPGKFLSPRHWVRLIPCAESSLHSPDTTGRVCVCVFHLWKHPHTRCKHRHASLWPFLQSFRVASLPFLTPYRWSWLLRSPPRLPERRSAGPERRTSRGEQTDDSDCGESLSLSLPIRTIETAMTSLMNDSWLL